MNNNTSNKNDQGIEPAMVVIMIIAAFGLIGLISDISEAMRETKRKRRQDLMSTIGSWDLTLWGPLRRGSSPKRS